MVTIMLSFEKGVPDMKRKQYVVYEGVWDLSLDRPRRIKKKNLETFTNLFDTEQYLAKQNLQHRNLGNGRVQYITYNIE